MKSSPGRRVAYDRFWGCVLLLTCVTPYRLDGRSYPWQLFALGEGAGVKAWLAAGWLAGLFAVAVGLQAWRGRWRHLLNFLLGGAMAALPAFAPAIWQTFPEANPGQLPLGGLGSVGVVMLLALTAIYAGSGMRIVRPSQIAGQALAALGALLLAVFAFLPQEGADVSFAYARLQRMRAFSAHWQELVPFCLVAAAAVCAVVNLLRNRAEVWIAKLARLLLVVGVVSWLALPRLAWDGTGAGLAGYLPSAWGGLRLLAPLLLCLDGCVAFVAITITRASD
ncbi:MAG: hypothetical protein ACYTEZ_06585 [Planctomycetota bacterium]|jgi:hypothetical protein